jgi:CRP/FNR family transcriptional regulator
MELINLIDKNSIFADLDGDTKSGIVKNAITRSYPSDQWVSHYGDVWPYLFLVNEGRITALKESTEGRSLIVTEFGHGDVFWGLGFFIEAAPTPAALVATAQSKIHLWSREYFLPVLLENGRMSWELTTLMVRRMLVASDIVEGLAFQPVVGRLAQFLLDRFEEDVGERINRDITLDEMAAHIGTTREMVCRMLHRLSRQDMIEITRTEFVFKNRDGLKRLVQNNRY